MERFVSQLANLWREPTRRDRDVSRADAESFAAAAACCGALDPMDDAQVPAWYRRRLAATLVRRALATAWERADVR